MTLRKAWTVQGTPVPAGWVQGPQQTALAAPALGEPGCMDCNNGQNEQLV